MSVPRGLSEEEAAAWAKLAASVTPLEGRGPAKTAARPVKEPSVPAPVQSPVRAPVRAPVMPRIAKAPVRHSTRAAPTPPDNARTRHGTGLDAQWERKLRAGSIAPDYTLDLHGHTLDTAYERLMRGLDQALAMEARVVLLIAGRSRPVDPADRGERRGAIRAKVLDWLAASRHEQAIAAIRRAHIRHGGEGALYLVLKRRR